MQIPISDYLGNKEDGVQVEESWSKDVPADNGVNVPVTQELIRDDNFLNQAVKQTEALRAKRFEQDRGPGLIIKKSDLPFQNVKSRSFLFFSVNEEAKSVTYLGTVQVDEELEARFKKDVSGRFFRKCVENEFPGRTDYMDIVCFNEGSSLKDVADSIGFMMESE